MQLVFLPLKRVQEKRLLLNKMIKNQLREFLEEKQTFYQQKSFIHSDPIQIPKSFSKKEDIEIAGFIAAILAWGKRPMIIKKAKQWMNAMDNQPYDFLMNAPEKDFDRFLKIIYRTVSGDDSLFMMYSLRNIYQNHGGLEAAFSAQPLDMRKSIIHFRQVFMEVPHLSRSEKHIANPEKGSAAKRINMFLRWMVRSAEGGVDFGIWKNIEPSVLMIPLDTHSGRMARQLGLLARKQNDWKAVEELTQNLRQLDPKDPIKYDFALFGMGVNEGVKL